jgi:PHD/YefM family antitoxin component YafN of YafNO toxin-antitoxin module
LTFVQPPAPIFIQRRGEEEMAMIAADELESLPEAACPLRSPATRNIY